MEIGTNHYFALFLTMIGCVIFWYITILLKQKASVQLLLKPTDNEITALLFAFLICILSWFKKIYLLYDPGKSIAVT